MPSFSNWWRWLVGQGVDQLLIMKHSNDPLASSVGRLVFLLVMQCHNSFVLLLLILQLLLLLLCNKDSREREISPHQQGNFLPHTEEPCTFLVIVFLLCGHQPVESTQVEPPFWHWHHFDFFFRYPSKWDQHLYFTDWHIGCLFCSFKFIQVKEMKQLILTTPRPRSSKCHISAGGGLLKLQCADSNPKRSKDSVSTCKQSYGKSLMLHRLITLWPRSFFIAAAAAAAAANFIVFWRFVIAWFLFLLRLNRHYISFHCRYWQKLTNLGQVISHHEFYRCRHCFTPNRLERQCKTFVCPIWFDSSHSTLLSLQKANREANFLKLQVKEKMLKRRKRDERN